MIARHWRGWTAPHDVDAYETLLKTRVLPELKEVPGYRGGYILRSEGTELTRGAWVLLRELVKRAWRLPHGLPGALRVSAAKALTAAPCAQGDGSVGQRS